MLRSNNHIVSISDIHGVIVLKENISLKMGLNTLKNKGKLIEELKMEKIYLSWVRGVQENICS